MTAQRRNLLAAAGAVGAVGGINLTYLGSIADNAAGDPNTTVSGADLGDPASNRVIVLAHVSSNNDEASSVTIAGVSATKAVESDQSISSSIWYASVPSGATGDIVVNGEGSDRYSFSWYAIYTDTPAPIDTDTATDSGGSATASIDTTSGGAVIYAISTRNDDTIPVPTWGGDSTPVEDHQHSFSSDTRNGACGSMPVDDGDDQTAENFTVSGLSDTSALSVASWEP